MNKIMNNHTFTFKDVLDTPYTKQLLTWRNQEFVRKNMMDDSIISMENHEKYLEKLRTTDEQRVFVAFFDDEPVAVMTFRFNENEGNIESGSYVIHEEDLNKGFGVITGYARFEYIFDKLPNGKMRTIILEHNKKNINLQKNFGCVLEGTETLIKSDGTEEKAFVYTMTKRQWERQRDKIQQLISRIVPVENIGRIEIRKK